MKEPNWNNSDKDNGIICLCNAKKAYSTNKELALHWVNQAILYLKEDKYSICDLAQCYYIKAFLLWNKDRNLSKLYL